MTTPAQTPDSPEPPLSEVHPATLEKLKQSLPGLRDFLQRISKPSRPEDIQAAANEVRLNFPGMDDLTLAAVCAWAAEGAIGFYQTSFDPEHISVACTYTEIALGLAWSLNVPETSNG